MCSSGETDSALSSVVFALWLPAPFPCLEPLLGPLSTLDVMTLPGPKPDGETSTAVQDRTANGMTSECLILADGRLSLTGKTSESYFGTY